MSEHTPTPWHMDQWEIYSEPAYQSVAMLLGMPSAVANGELIVKAVNSHDALVKKLDDAIGIIHDLLGLELGSSERAMKFLDDNSPTAADVRGILGLVGGAAK